MILRTIPCATTSAKAIEEVIIRRPSILLQSAAPKIQSILSSYEDFFPILSKSQTLQASQIMNQHELSRTERVSKRRAAVLLPLIEMDSKAAVLFTLRSPSMSSHANEISFPGGHVNDTDAFSSNEEFYGIKGEEAVIRAALRETREELNPSAQTTFDYTRGIQILGQTSALPSFSGTMVSTVLGALTLFSFPNEHILQSVFPERQNAEVQKVFAVTVEELLKTESAAPLQRVRGGLGPVFDTRHGRIWGLTALILRPVLHKVLKPVFIDDSETKHTVQARFTVRSK